MDSRSQFLRRAVPVATLLVAVFVLLTLSFRPETDATLWWALFDAAHLPLFLLIGWALVWTAPRRGAREIAWVVVTAGIIAAGTEVAQHYVGRDASLTDFLWNVAGGALGVALGRAWLGGGEAGDEGGPEKEAARETGDEGRSPTGPRSPLAVVPLGLLTLLLFGLAATPAVQELRALRHFRSALPRIGDFETGLELRWWRGVGGARLARTPAWAAHGSASLSLSPGRGRSTGAGIDGRALDWSEYASLAFAVRNPGDAFSLTVRVDDDTTRASRTGGWTGELEVPRGESALAIPLARVEAGSRGRPLRLGRIRRLILFAESARVPAGFLLDDVRLVPRRLTTGRTPQETDD